METVDAHVAAARQAAGSEHRAMLELCDAPESSPQADTPATAPPTPDRSEWHAEPAKVFDNLFFVGEIEYSAWAVKTSAGIIIVDALWPYSVEEEIVGGLQKLGLDPKTIKYVLVSHGHADHAGGARYLQDRFGARVIMSAADWDLLDQQTWPWPKPVRDLVASDGQKLTLGDTTLTIYVTPGTRRERCPHSFRSKTKESRISLLNGAGPDSTSRLRRTSPSDSGLRATAVPRNAFATS
jgi:metallo-beta-lactamase class B